MGMDADVIIIGPRWLLERFEVQDYPLNFYGDCPPAAMITGTIAVAFTSEDSRLLAELCGVEPWDLRNHRVKSKGQLKTLGDVHGMQTIQIGNDRAYDIHAALTGIFDTITQHPQWERLEKEVYIWYRPNG